jgi:hypothetical protein
MTVVAIMAGLLPIMWTSGTGSEVMRRIAAPMVGGMVSSVFLTLIVIPVLYALGKEWQLRREQSKSLGVPAADRIWHRFFDPCHSYYRPASRE